MEKHDLHSEFPELEQKIHELKISNNHFKKLFETYHTVNNEIQRIETGVENTSDELLNRLRIERLTLKDQLFALLTKN
jgi:uncharacterized protein YdcH (DUF465 family)